MAPLSSGSEALDRLIGGSLGPGSRVMVSAPPFHGKHVLIRQMAIANMAKGVPCIMVLTDATAEETRDRLRRLDPKFDDYEKKGLCWFVDAHAATIDAVHQAADVRFVDGPDDLNVMSLAIHEIQRAIVDKHILVVDSVSTLAHYNGAQETFRFIQTLLGRARRAGACSWLLLDRGVHRDFESRMFETLVDGVMDLESDGDTRRLRVRGLGVGIDYTVLEYSFDPVGFEVASTLAEGRIR